MIWILDTKSKPKRSSSKNKKKGATTRDASLQKLSINALAYAVKTDKKLTDFQNGTNAKFADLFKKLEGFNDWQHNVKGT